MFSPIPGWAEMPSEGKYNFPRRPRTPLKIDRDLMKLVKAQGASWGPEAEKEQEPTLAIDAEDLPESQTTNTKPLIKIDGPPTLPIQRKDRQSVGSQNARKSISSKPGGRLSIGFAHQTANTRRATRLSAGMFSEDHARRRSTATALRHGVGLGPTFRRQTSKKSIEEEKTRARRPLETGSLSADLDQLVAAAAAEPMESHTFNPMAFAYQQSGIRPSTPPSSRRRSTANWDRPWRLTAPRRRVSSKPRHSIIGSAKKASFIADDQAARDALVQKVRKRASRVWGPEFQLMDVEEEEDEEETKAPSPRKSVIKIIGDGSEDDQKGDIDHSPSSGTRLTVWKLGQEMNVPQEILQTAIEIFKDFALSPDQVVRMKRGDFHDTELFTDCAMNKDQFAKVLCHITGAEDVNDLPKGLLFDAFAAADANGGDDIDFREFLLWYSRHGFSEEVLLTKEQRDMRIMARKHDIGANEVEHYKRAFDLFDEDASGVIEYGEFKRLLSVLLKVPEHLELPQSRVRQFWLETDLDADGVVGFEEFLIFYTKFFDCSTGDPLEDFYRGLRPNAMRVAQAKSRETTTKKKYLESLIANATGDE